MRKFVATVFALGLLSAPAYAEEDTAACLSACTKKFAECTKGGIATKPCLEARKKCIEACGNS